MKKIDRTGEVSVNNFGSKIIIKEYRKATDIDIYFPDKNSLNIFATSNGS